MKKTCGLRYFKTVKVDLLIILRYARLSSFVICFNNNIFIVKIIMLEIKIFQSRIIVIEHNFSLIFNRINSLKKMYDEK